MYLELCITGSHLMNWIRQNKLYRLLFCRRREDGGKGFPVRASIEWLLYEEMRVFLTRFYQRPNSPTRRLDLYSKVFRRSVQNMIGTFLLCHVISVALISK